MFDLNRLEKEGLIAREMLDWLSTGSFAVHRIIAFWLYSVEQFVKVRHFSKHTGHSCLAEPVCESAELVRDSCSKHRVHLDACFQSDSGISPSTRTEATTSSASTCPAMIRLATAVSCTWVSTLTTLSSVMAPLAPYEKKVSPHSTFEALLSVLLPLGYTTIM